MGPLSVPSAEKEPLFLSGRLPPSTGGQSDSQLFSEPRPAAPTSISAQGALKVCSQTAEFAAVKFVVGAPHEAPRFSMDRPLS